jgi:S-DNA-T family DNA segregation ATPase FtsK/SpoIIIE
MPKKKTTANKPKIKSEAKRSIVGVILIAIALLSFLSFFSSAGVFGKGLNGGIGFLFGVGKFILPFALLYIGLTLLARPKDRGLYYFQLFVLIMGLLLFLGLIQLIQFSDAKESLAEAQKGLGGGYIGHYVSVGTQYIFGYWGAFVALITGFITAGIIVMNQSIHLDGIVDWIKEVFAPNNSENTIAIAPTDTSEVKAENTRIFHQDAEDEDKLDNKKVADKGNIIPKTPEWMTESLFNLPTVDLLEKGKTDDIAQSGDTKKSSEIIKSTLSTFGIEVEMGKIDVGPSVTRFMLRPSNGIKLSRITSLQSDLALAMAAQAIRIEAPIPGMSYVGVETPNAKRATVRIRNIFESKEFNENDFHLPLALGLDVMNKVIVFPLEKMPHLLIAGATGAGKSMGLNAMILSMLYKNPPSKLKFIFIDPKRVELSTYNGIPHLLTPAIVSPEKAMNALNWCVTEMERRYEVLARMGSRNIFTYNEKIASGTIKAGEDEQEYEIMPFIVVVIDELADLMSSHKKEVEGSIVRIAQMARAVGIHLILATQRPSTDVITGLIKANLPSRVSFQVASQIDSRTVLDMMGAEKLLGMGDMLFLGGDLGKPQRIQGAFVPEHEVKAVVEWLKSQGENEYNLAITETDTPKQIYHDGGVDYGEGTDQLFEQAKDLVLQTGKGSASLLQRRLKVGYARAARLLDELEEAGIVGPAEGSKPREVFSDGHIEENE